MSTAATETWTVQRLLAWTSGRFKEIGIPSGSYNAEALLSAALGWSRLDLYTKFDVVVGKPCLGVFREFVKRRLAREPLQYILGSCGFMNCELAMGKGVFIPQQDTEALVEKALKLIEEAPEKGRPQVLDIGTGSGAIAVSVAKEIEAAEVLATDISKDALALAEKNAASCGVADRVKFADGDLFAAVPAGKAFDFILSNPPYIAKGERDGLMPEVRDYEPPEALFAGADGLDVIKRLVAEAPAFLNEGGWLIFEIGASQKEAVAALFAKSAAFRDVEFVKDYGKRDRVAVGRKAI